MHLHDAISNLKLLYGAANKRVNKYDQVRGEINVKNHDIFRW